MKKTLAKKDFPSWVKRLAENEIYAPVERDGVWNYEPVSDLEGLDPRYPNTVQAPKKIVLPQRETLLEFHTDESGKPVVREVLPEKKGTVVFGVRPCDARALTLTDRVFGGTFRDPYYWRRREDAALVGLACVRPPSANCFCPTVGGSPHSSEGLDVLMTDLGDRYLLESFTDRGRDLLEKGGGIMAKPSPGDEKERERVHREADGLIERSVGGIARVTETLQGMFDSPFWDEEAASCIRCGICTFLCPACHCFDMADELSSASPARGRRVRTWDTCQFPDFTMHSSGHNPRPDRAARLRQRVLHKFQYFVEHHGEFQCTGCGRCVDLCPVGIDIIDILNEVPGHER